LRSAASSWKTKGAQSDLRKEEILGFFIYDGLVKSPILVILNGVKDL